MINFKVGIMGAGDVAGKVADTLNQLTSFEPYAIASRDIEKANEFGDKYNIEKRYGSYEELVQDPEVELIYIATPHSHHAEQAKMCINARKPVLVEKAFSYNAASTKEVLDLAREKNVFCGEAMWIRYMPIYLILIDYLKKGVIGRVHNVVCSLCYDLRRKQRIVRPELGGGALLDLGVYPLNLISMIYGDENVNIASSCARLDTGVDAHENVQFNFKGAKNASFTTSIMYKADNRAFIYGDGGYVEIDNINCPTSFQVYRGDRSLVADIKIPEHQISGYEYEFIAARNTIILGKIEPPQMPHAETLRIMAMMDGLRARWDYKMPMEVQAEEQ